MIQYFLERPYLIAIMAAVILLTLFVCVKAGQASAKRSKANEAIIKRLKEENELRNEFSVLTEKLAADADAIRLFKGVALNLQKKISDAEDMISEFDALNDAQRDIYALSFVVEDGEKALSDFFRANGQPLTRTSLGAVKRLFNGKIYEIFEKEYNAFDSENEDASMIPSEIDALDKEFAEIISADEICRKAGGFIKDNIDKFIYNSASC
ncbi:MAG: hypothetical protein IJZ07_05240 [Clostridia bacterium]|nr:hypothetical protein [Clostridia bacterium]